MPDNEGHTLDTDAIVALSPAEAELIAYLLRAEGPKSGRAAEYEALADRIVGALPVGAS